MAGRAGGLFANDLTREDCELFQSGDGVERRLRQHRRSRGCHPQVRVTEVVQPNGSSACIVTVPGTNGLEKFPARSLSTRSTSSGGRGPVTHGKFTVVGDSPAVVDDAMRRMSDILGPESSGVGRNLSVTSTGQNRREFGYGSARRGRALWEATH